MCWPPGRDYAGRLAVMNDVHCTVQVQYDREVIAITAGQVPYRTVLVIKTRATLIVLLLIYTYQGVQIRANITLVPVRYTCPYTR